MINISKQSFEKDFAYLFQIEQPTTEIKLSKYELMEPVENEGELFYFSRNDGIANIVNEFVQFTSENQNIDVILINFFTNIENDETLIKLQQYVDDISDILKEETQIIWCTTSKKYNQKKIQTEIFYLMN